MRFNFVTPTGMFREWCHVCCRATLHDLEGLCLSHSTYQTRAQGSTQPPVIERCPHCNGAGTITWNPDTGEELQ